MQRLLQNSFGWPFHVGLLHPGLRQRFSSEAEDEASPEAAEEPADVEHMEMDVASAEALPLPLRGKMPQPGCMQMNCFCGAGSPGAFLSAEQREP